MSKEDTDLSFLAEWYASQCDGEWEHQFGVQLQTLDNPGWRLEIEVEDTFLEGRPFEALERNCVGDTSWLICRLEGKKFVADCGPHDLQSVLAIFREWATVE